MFSVFYPFSSAPKGISLGAVTQGPTPDLHQYLGQGQGTRSNLLYLWNPMFLMVGNQSTQRKPVRKGAFSYIVNLSKVMSRALLCNPFHFIDILCLAFHQPSDMWCWCSHYFIYFVLCEFVSLTVLVVLQDVDSLVLCMWYVYGFHLFQLVHISDTADNHVSEILKFNIYFHYSVLFK